MPSSEKGLTLVELLVVLAVLSVLAITVAVSLKDAHIKAVRKEALSNVTRVASALDQRYADGNFTYTDGTTTGCPGVQTYKADGSTVGALPVAIQGAYYEYDVMAEDPDGDGLCERYLVTARGIRAPASNDALICLDSTGVQSGPWG